MSSAFKCDRCEELKEGHPSLKYNVQRVGMHVDVPEIVKLTGDFEVCVGCADVLARKIGEGLEADDE